MELFTVRSPLPKQKIAVQSKHTDYNDGKHTAILHF